MPESGETVRTFVAVLLSEAAAREAERLLDRLRPLARCRWVTRAQLHITLRFLGELSLAAVERVRSAVAAVAVQPFDIELHRAGTFPNLARPRTLWLGGDRGAPELTALAGRVNDALFEVGIPRNGRPFSPHLTLARSDGSPLPPALMRELERVPSVAWRCSDISLMRSRLTPRGAVYTRL